jgi:hypothetical protein
MSDDDGNPCIHLQRADAPAVDREEEAGVHHVALACKSAQQWRAKLEAMGIDYQEKEFTGGRMIQFNLRDPNGVRLELLFEMP